MTEKNIPIGQAAEFLGVSIDTVRRWDEKGIIKSARPDGKDRYFSVVDLEKVKFSQPLTISEAAQKLDISEVTLRRLEEKGLITPDRDSANNRIYTLKCLENFIKSDYFLRRQEIEDKILSAPETADTKNSDYQKDIKSLSDQHRVLSAEIQKHNDRLGKLNRFRKSFYAALIVAGVSLLILTTICTLLFIAYPEKTGRWFGLYSVKAVASSANKTSENVKVLGASFSSPKLVDSNILGKILQPIGGLSLEITRSISPDSYNRVVGQQAITDVNDVLGVNANNNIVSKYNLTFPDSSYLIIPDTNLIPNLNADYLRGKVPGTNPGDLAYYNEQGKIVGVESNTGAEIIAFDTPMTYNTDTKTLSISYSSDNLKTENGQLTTIQGISTASTPTFAGITIGGINGLLIATNGKVSSISDNSTNWDTAYSHTSDTANPHNVTSSQILPNQAGQNGKILGTNGSNVVWTTNSLGVAWGAITGSLGDQGDLVTALGGKETAVTAGLASQYYRGDKTWQTLDKSAVGLGSVENTALSTWAGTANITTVGTIATGTWNATAIGDSKISSSGNWNTAYGWGNHAVAGYFIKASDDLDDVAAGITNVHLTTTLKSNYDAAYSHTSLTNNPHSVTASQVGLGSVDNTSDINKSVLSATKLTTARAINGVDFDGTAPITIYDSTKVPTSTTVNGKALSGNITLDTSNIADSLNKRYVSDANLVVIGNTSNTNTGDQTLVGLGGVPTTTTVNGHALSSNVTVTATDLGLGSVENTALSTWAGTANITTVGTVGTGTWNATAIANSKIASALTGKTYNGLTLTAAANGFTIAGGTTPKTLTVGLDASVAGTNTGDQNLSGYALVNQTMYIGTTAVAINRTTGALALAGVSIDGSSGSVSGLTITAGASISGSNTGDQTLVGLGGVATTRNLTINGTTQDLSTDRTWTITNISGNAATVTGLSIASGKTLTASNTLTLTSTDGATLGIGGGGTLGSAAYTASGAYDVAGAAAAITPTTLGLVIGTNVQAYNSNLTAINQALTTTSSPSFTAVGATTFTGALSGNATTATNLSSISTTFSGTYPMVVNVNGTIYSHTNVTFAGSTGTLTAPTFSGALTGHASSDALIAQTFYIGTTQVAINRASAALTLAGITLITPNIGSATGTSLGIGGALAGIASFHGSAANHDSFFGGAFGNTLNFDSEVNGDTGVGYLNFYGYLGGQTKYRDLIISDGKGGTVVTVDGSANSTTFAGAVSINGNTTLGDASTDVTTNTGRMVFRTAASDPQHATAGSRPAGTVGEIVYYGGKMYFCTNAATPTWEKITSL